MRVLKAPNAVVGRILDTAARASGQPFLTLARADGGEQALTYSQLIERSEQWARRYREAGLQPGDRVLVILEHCEALYASYLGALLGAQVPAYFAHPSEKVDEARYCESVNALLERVGGDFVVTSRAIVERLRGKLAVPAGLLEDGAPLPGAQRRSRPALSEDALFLQFSSGTTGLKKGVPVSAKALLWQVDAYAERIGAGNRDVIASWLPLYHDMGLIACFFLPLLRGVPLVAMSPFDWVAKPERLLGAIERHRATLVWLPNFAYNFLATRVPASGKWDLSSLRAVVNCSEPVLEESHRAFLNRFAPLGLRPQALGASYAMAENTFAVTSGGIDAALVTDTLDGRVVVSSGRALPDTSIRILGPEGRTLGDGELGEIAIATPCLFSGYVGNREGTRASLREGWFHTGDLGYLRAGELYVVGRSSDMLIVGGRNVFPQDVEAVVSEIDGVIPGRCVACGIDDAALGTQLLLVIAETRESDTTRRADLKRRIHAAVVSQLDLVPGEVALVDHMWLHKSTSGKLSRVENRDRFLATKLSTLVENVRGCVVQALNAGAARSVPHFTDDEDLLKSGIVDSFSLVSLQLALEDKFGKQRTRRIRETPGAFRSVRALAAALEEQTVAQPQNQVETQIQANTAAELDLKYQLAPQMRDVEAQPYEWVAYLMRRGMPNYRSPTLSSDEHGFRSTWRDGKPLSYAAFMADARPKAVVLGNSFAYGIGTTQDAKTFASCLNGSEIVWYNLAQRASVCLQERLACELYGPEAPVALAWVSGVNNLISLIVGEGAPGNPAPFVGERQYALRMMPGARFPAHRSFEERYRAMLRSLELDLSVLALRLGKRARLGFFLQPSASWIDKPFSVEERALIERFDSAGAVLQQAHHPRHLGPWHARFASELAAICKRWAVEFIDSNADARFRSQNWLFLDRTHMNDAGHAVMAELIADWLGSV